MPAPILLAIMSPFVLCGFLAHAIAAAFCGGWRMYKYFFEKAVK